MQCRHLLAGIYVNVKKNKQDLNGAHFDIGLQQEIFLHEKLFCNLCESLE